MGTNYYVSTKPPCSACGHGGEELHIGKSSAGWCFSLHVIPELGIHDLPDWERFWKGKHIRDEYGNPLTSQEMYATIVYRKWVGAAGHEGVPGPNGLSRHPIVRNCVGHGAGTWDLIEGEFS